MSLSADSARRSDWRQVGGQPYRRLPSVPQLGTISRPQTTQTTSPRNRYGSPGTVARPTALTTGSLRLRRQRSAAAPRRSEAGEPPGTAAADTPAPARPLSVPDRGTGPGTPDTAQSTDSVRAPRSSTEPPPHPRRTGPLNGRPTSETQEIP
jgi:hypothetical protein